MELGITIPLQRQLGLSAPSYGTEAEMFYCWELHGILLQGCKTLAAVNASNCFTVAVCHLQGSDWKRYPEMAVTGIREALAAEGYTEEEIGLYFQQAGAPLVTKTHGRRPVAGLNRMMNFLWAAPMEIDDDRNYQRSHCHFANSSVCRAAGFDDRATPSEFLECDMKRCGIIK